MARRIAILGGTGAEGSGLAFRMATAGEHILIGSREASRAQETAKFLRARIGGAAQIEGLDNSSAAAARCRGADRSLPPRGGAAQALEESVEDGNYRYRYHSAPRGADWRPC